MYYLQKQPTREMPGLESPKNVVGARLERQ